MSVDLSQVFDKETTTNLSQLPEERVQSWGRDGVWNPCSDKYLTKTEVRSGDNAYTAFEKYTEYFNHVLDSWTPTSDTLVLLPCGSTKPIGSSTIHKKKLDAVRNAGLDEADVVVVSEPCTIVPREYRLSVPAVNYDFPPEYTVEDEYPDVFELFTDRLAEWLDSVRYDTIYPYLISGHMNKFTTAVDKMSSTPTIHTIPSASYNPETESYSGDRFKKPKELEQKVRAVRRYRANETISVDGSYAPFFENRFS